uniref:Endonuclease/exonuclease/phosphatase domain-containing protein n=1 Tax=Arundo donax TaxID=35708 RepID=A0A0A9FUY6_ARUDO
MSVNHSVQGSIHTRCLCNLLNRRVETGGSLVSMGHKRMLRRSSSSRSCAMSAPSHHALCDGPWILGGDFNLIYQAADKNNDNLNRAMMGRFRRFLDDMDIKEIPLLGRKYTWSNE